MRIRSIGVISMVAALALLGGADAAQAKGKGHKHSGANCCKSSQKHSCSGSYCCTRKGNDIGSALHKKANMSTEMEMLKKGGQCGVVCSGKGPITLFAPTDAAYKKLGAARLEALKKDPAKLAQYHIVPKKVMAADLKPAGSLTTKQGEHLMTNVGKDGKGEVDGCLIIEQDIVCSNGVIHILDEVPIPERGK